MELNIDKNWTLFLDRDGVINSKLPGNYVTKISEFQWIDGVKESIPKLRKIFGKLIVITNQQGIGKGFMQESDLMEIHQFMNFGISAHTPLFDAIYFCPHLDESGSKCRKPETGMAMMAKKDFPEIDFRKTIMVGDSLTDMEFGRKIGAITVFISKDKAAELNNNSMFDFVFHSLKEFTEYIYESENK